ncbi:MAG: HTTM domain-containing protein [Shouchella clausii]|jgi:antimicrobial peptide system SdpB family protein
MFERLEKKVISWAYESQPWTNVYGLARSLIALSTALTLCFNDAKTLFLPSSDSDIFPRGDLLGISIFTLVPNEYVYLNLVRYVSIVLLLIVVSGWRPQVTGIIHWYISYSFLSSAMTIDGGDSVAAVFTLLLLPLTLSDSRKWHWLNKEASANFQSENLAKKIVALVTLVTIRVQVAILYFHSTVAKLGEEDWQNGTAVWYYMQDAMLGLNPMLFQMFEGVLTSALIVIPTWGTIILQIVLVAALFSPKKHRNYFFLLALIMHEVFAIMLGLISFSLAMIGILILYLRPLEQPFKLPKLKSPLQKQHTGNIKDTSSKEVG